MDGLRPRPIISIVIPALDEASQIPHTLATLGDKARCEVIVVDGGSRDETPSLAASLGARVLVSPARRATQMNAGAVAAKGSLLLFLHADTHPPRNFDRHLVRALTRKGAAAGAFRLRFDGRRSPLLRVIEWTANWRARYLQMPFGDQGIFLPKDLFMEMGGFREMPIMEDVEMIRRLRRRGRIAIVPHPIVTSSRRYRVSGTWRTLLANKVAILGYCLGVSPWRIFRWYDRQGRSPMLD